MAEVARINLLPFHSFEFNTLEEIYNSFVCSGNSQTVYLFPNPTFGDVKLKFLNSRLGNYSFELINVIGKTLWSHDFHLNRSNQEVLLPIPELSKGIYLYQIKDQEGKRLSSKRLTVVDP